MSVSSGNERGERFVKRKTAILAIILVALILLAVTFGAIFDGTRAPKTLEPTAIIITYRVNHQYKNHTISNREEIKEMLGMLGGAETTTDRSFGSVIHGEMTVRFADGEEIRYIFIRRNWLQRRSGDSVTPDTLFLSNTMLYDKICAILTKVEGSPIDVLKDNP